MTEGAPLVLGIATAGPVEAAVCKGDEVFARAGQGQALEELIRCVERALAGVGATIRDVDLIAVCAGPGSFTGLRIGASFAKSAAQALGLPIVGVSAFDVAEGLDSVAPYPRVALVEGKRDYYYVRVTDASGAPPRFLRGSRDEIAAAGVSCKVFSLPAGEQARRVAVIGLSLYRSGVDTHWANLALDYGQRPNAVLNWETRRAVSERGGPSASSKQRKR